MKKIYIFILFFQVEKDLGQNDMFYTLKRMRDIECLKLNQSSNVVRALSEKPESDWNEKLLAETILLENGKYTIYFFIYKNEKFPPSYLRLVSLLAEPSILLSITNFETFFETRFAKFSCGLFDRFMISNLVHVKTGMGKKSVVTLLKSTFINISTFVDFAK